MEKVLIILGSKSNIEVAEKAASVLKNSNVDYDMRICSAHRTPDMLDKILKGNYNVIIAIAGLAAHLPGVIASKTVVPVIGIPCKDNYEGLDALLSIAQMPPGIPVMCVGVERAEIAAINAIRIMRNYDKVNI
ncbi:MAG: AIR carboxylase family protein, partial [bacterium]|nr:AIR carboxylase family protein [bacterium]